jgi:acyl dehydratase
VRLVATAVRAVLLQLKTVRVVTPVLLGDVVAVLALLASQRDLRPDIGGSHDGVPF